MRVDAVITWVDGTDPAWRSKRSRFKPDAGTIETANVEGRFRDNGELKYLLRSLEKYWPFEGDVIIVTDDQIPDFVNPGSGIRIVDHREILEECYLPTFSSKAIVSALHKIPGLSENFVVFNDDIFLSRPVIYEDFFGETGCRIYLTDELIPDYLPEGVLSGHQASIIASEWIREEFGKKGLFFIPAHYPLGINKTLISEMERLHQNLFHDTRSEKFRSLATHSIMIGLYVHYCHALGIADTKGDEALYLFSDAIEEGWAKPLLIEALGSKLCVCIQDTMDNREDVELFQNNYNRFLEELFPQPSRWELRTEPTKPVGRDRQRPMAEEISP